MHARYPNGHSEHENDRCWFRRRNGFKILTMKSSRVAAHGLAIVVLVGAGAFKVQRPARIVGDSGAIRIHLLGHAIGSERYVVRPDGNALALTDTFEFTDRGGRVQLASTFRYS